MLLVIGVFCTFVCQELITPSLKIVCFSFVLNKHDERFTQLQTYLTATTTEKNCENIYGWINLLCTQLANVALGIMNSSEGMQERKRPYTCLSVKNMFV